MTMEITYLTQLSTFNERPFPNEGLSMEQIQDLRAKFNNGKPFPKAFEEYLYLAGTYNNIAFDGPDTLEELQHELAQVMEDFHKKIDRPWFAFHEQELHYLIIFLDETNDDPTCYICSPNDDKVFGDKFISEAGYTFVTIVNETIRRLKNGTF